MRVQRPTLGPKYELFSYIYFIIVPSISPNIFFWLNLTINCTLVGELLYLKLIIPFLQSCSFLLAHTTVFSAHSNSNKTQTSKVGPKANQAKIQFINTTSKMDSCYVKMQLFWIGNGPLQNTNVGSSNVTKGCRLSYVYLYSIRCW